MLEAEDQDELTDINLKEAPGNHNSKNISVYSGLILVAVLGFLSYILYLQVQLSVLLAPLAFDYKEYTKFGVISDLHLDLKQTSTTCQWWDRKNYTHYESAYGTTGCDTRYNFAAVTVDSFSELLKDIGSVDLIFNLGDLVNHYTTNFVKNGELISNATELFQSKLPVPIYSTIGNNDLPEDYLQPINSSQFYESFWMRISPLLNATAESLEKHKAAETFSSGGYYTIEHSVQLQIVSINSVSFSVRSNVEISSGLQQLQWLSQVLSDAKIHKKVVVIIGHVCPSLSLFQISRHKPNRTMLWKEEFTLEYNRIVSQYTDVIKFSLFSHQHDNQWFVKESKNDKSETGYVSYYVIPSVSPVYENEPSYSIGIVDNSWNLLDLLFYFCPLSFYTRQDADPLYLFHFSFKERYFYFEDTKTSFIKDMPIKNEHLHNLTLNLLNVNDMQNTYKKILFNSYQLLYNFGGVSPYQLFCIMTQNTIQGAKDCLSRYSFEF